MSKYVRVPWPESQSLMEYKWFKEECVLDTDTSADYLCPISRYKEVQKNLEMGTPNTLLKSALVTIKHLLSVDKDSAIAYADSTLVQEIEDYLNTQFIPAC